MTPLIMTSSQFEDKSQNQKLSCGFRETDITIGILIKMTQKCVSSFMKTILESFSIISDPEV